MSLKSRSPFFQFVALGIASGLVSSCGSKSSDTPSSDKQPVAAQPEATQPDDSDKKTSDPNVQTKVPEGGVKISGQLALQLGLQGDKKKGVVLYALDYKSNVVSKQKIEVDAEGNFEVGVPRDRGSEMMKIIENGAVNRELAKAEFPDIAPYIENASDQEIIEGISEEIENIKKHPELRFVLVSYDITGNPEQEAASMQFIGLPTASASLKMLPGPSLKGDLGLGKIVGEGDEATATLPASESVDLPATVIEELAGTSQTLKILKNDWMNPQHVADVTPWFGYVVTDLNGAVDKFVTPTKAATTFGGGGYYIRPLDIGATFGEVCPENPANPSDTSGNEYSATPAKILKWFPPVVIAATQNDSGTYGPTQPYSSQSQTYVRTSQYNEIQCSKGNSNSLPGGGLYTRARQNGDKTFQLQMGGRIGVPAPIGLWRLNVDNNEVGRWDLSAAAPYDSDKDPVIYIPALKVVTNGNGIATSVEAKFYFYDKLNKNFREVIDVSGLKSLLHSFNLDGSYKLTRQGGDLSVDQKNIVFGDDGIVRLELVPENQAKFPCSANDATTQCIRNFGFSYFIGSISYRLSLSEAGNL